MQEWLLDIKGILSSKFENNVISFGAKMLVKWPLIPIIVQRDDTHTQKAARVNGPGKTKAKGEKEIWNGNRKSKTKKFQTFTYAHAPN